MLYVVRNHDMCHLSLVSVTSAPGAVWIYAEHMAGHFA